MSRAAALSTTCLSTPFMLSTLRRILESRLLIARVYDITNRQGLGQ